MKHSDNYDQHLNTMDGAWIETYTGKQFFFNNVTEDMLDLQDIAHSLSLQCRYNGHTREFLSVAEHCVLMADHVFLNASEVAGQTVKPAAAMMMARTALYHDVAEAYIGDMPRPLKQMFPLFKKLEQDIEMVAAKCFGIIWPFPAWLKELDTRILIDERRDMMNPSGNSWFTDDMKEIGIPIGGMNPAQAEGMFKAMAHMDLKAWQDYASNRSGPFFSTPEPRTTETLQ